MRRKKLIRSAVLIIFGIAALIAVYSWTHPERVFKGTTAITFTERGFQEPDMKIIVTNPADVQRILGTIQLAPKSACMCSHIQQATFQKPNEMVEASICGHCFSILGRKKDGWYPNVREYWMPAGFYAEFRRLALSRTNEHWHVGE